MNQASETLYNLLDTFTMYFFSNLQQIVQTQNQCQCTRRFILTSP
jgi:hypothetical protein